MHVLRLDHATINTVDLEGSIAFYDHFLGLKPGFRPDFGFDGAWLYPEGGDYPILHLISRSRDPDGGMFDHVAFRVAGLADYLAKVKASGSWYRALPILASTQVQVQHYDPNKVMIEATFEDEPLPPSEVRP